MTAISPIAREYLERGRSDACPIIDMHGHIGPYHGGYMPSAPVDAMLHRMDRCGVLRIVCSHHVALTYDVVRGNALMQEVINRHPNRILGYWVINPNRAAAIEDDLVAFSNASGFVGLKLWSDYHLAPLTSPLYAPALRFADERALLILVHTWGASPYDGPSLLREVAGQYPRARFLMAHAAHGEWEQAGEIARDLSNVFIDLTSVAFPNDPSLAPNGTSGHASRSAATNGVIEYLLSVAGSDKVVFGSDLPWFSQHYQAGAILFADIDDNARHAVLHGNAERLLAPFLRDR